MPMALLKRSKRSKLGWKTMVALLTGTYREAQQKTGKYVMLFLEHLKRHLGVHAFVFVAYQDEEEAVKISE